ncbi:hypothetical protein BpHYR1_049563 [Brachionus plicatilis]|uniref:Uncharacterized protein n=1 Tax=Brachionus plicatilis TaxID=10195 RepID=A0A3M7RJE6_BRAPC|nr:hypothetical protein BpHYR1_049563 [Brachionus plicatilis]
MSSSASILENNFNDTINDAEDSPKNKRSTAKTYDCVQECESLEKFKRLAKNLHFDNVTWNFHSTNKLADCDKHTFNSKKLKMVKQMVQFMFQTISSCTKKKCYFDSVGMDTPIQANRKKGRPKDTAGALEHQLKETQASICIANFK